MSASGHETGNGVMAAWGSYRRFGRSALRQGCAGVRFLPERQICETTPRGHSKGLIGRRG